MRRKLTSFSDYLDEALRDPDVRDAYMLSMREEMHQVWTENARLRAALTNVATLCEHLAGKAGNSQAQALMVGIAGGARRGWRRS